MLFQTITDGYCGAVTLWQAGKMLVGELLKRPNQDHGLLSFLEGGTCARDRGPGRARASGSLASRFLPDTRV